MHAFPKAPTSDTSPAAAEALKVAAHNRYAIPAIERTRRHLASVWAIVGIGVAAVLLQWSRFLTKKGLAAVLVACIVSLAAGPIVEQLKTWREPPPTE
jgi:hypothetical protein